MCGGIEQKVLKFGSDIPEVVFNAGLAAPIWQTILGLPSTPRTAERP